MRSGSGRQAGRQAGVWCGLQRHGTGEKQKNENRL